MTVPRRENLSAEERAIAQDLAARAELLMAHFPSLALAEAIDLAAIEGGYELTTKPREPKEHDA